MRSLPGSFRARTSLRTRPDVGVGKLAESEAIACRENWTVMIASWCQREIYGSFATFDVGFRRSPSWVIVFEQAMRVGPNLGGQAVDTQATRPF
jgi:hypothetical protein